jgi:hypothetical protein
MISVNKQLTEIKKKFPEQTDRIEQLFKTNEDFRTLCSDLYLCLQNLQRFKNEFDDMRLSMEEYKDSIKEYKNISTELENELSHFILEAY